MADPTEPKTAEIPADDSVDGEDDAKKPAAANATDGDEKYASKDDATVAGEADAAKEHDEKSLFARGNPLRWKRGGITTLVSTTILFLLMAHNGQLRMGVPLGLVLVAITAWGVMDIVGSFDDARDDDVASVVDIKHLAAPIFAAVAALVLFCLSLMGGQSGLGQQWHWAILVPAAFIGLTIAVFDLGVKLGPLAKDESGTARPFWLRHGFWLVTAAGLLYLPTLGSYSLWDPWETHYGEVAREMLARDDWVSLWWAQDGWFWSKPILNFWMQAVSMASLGTHYMPDQMMLGMNGNANAHPEWVVRAPNFLLTTLAMYLLYKGAAKVWGRRAAFIGGLVLATMPDWYFLCHQTMTDMPFVASMTGAMGLLLLGLNTGDGELAKLYELRVGDVKLRVSAWHLVFGTILICAIPQIIYLATRNMELVLHGSGQHGFRAHWDEFRSGSGGGNCGLPGNEACQLQSPASAPKNALHPEGIRQILLRLFGGFEPIVQAFLWGSGVAALLYMNWGERRRQRLYYLAAWFMAAIATMGKGPAGFGLPMLCGFAYVASTRRWKEIVNFEIVGGLLTILIVAIPWFVAMYVRHGSPFTDRLIFHDMFNRAFSHVHDTNEGDDTSFRFYVWQLGYAFFPWTGFAPLGLIYWLRKSDTGDRIVRAIGLGAPTTKVVEDVLGELRVTQVKAEADPVSAVKGDGSVFFVMWFVFAFTLFSFMGTKFHHYIFPAVPPVAMLIGVVLDDMLEGKAIARALGWVPIAMGLCGALVVAVVLVTAWAGGSTWGDHVTSWQSIDKRLMYIGIGLVGLALALRFGWADVFAPKLTDAKRGAVKSAYRGESVAGDESLAKAKTPADEESELLDPAKAHERLMLGGAALGSAFILGIVGRDLSIKPENADQPGAIRLLHLFTYNYRRAWPESLDFNAVMTAFSILACVIAVAFVVQRIRRYVAVTSIAFAFVWAVWGLDVYMVRTAPHWGQREVLQAYYENRHDASEPIVAYQMNWKGENFYTGNKIPAFVSSGAAFTTWVKQQKEKGVTVMFFVTEHSRTGGLRSEAGAKSYKEITDKDLCNKFVLVRAEL